MPPLHGVCLSQSFPEVTSRLPIAKGLGMLCSRESPGRSCSNCEHMNRKD